MWWPWFGDVVVVFQFMVFVVIEFEIIHFTIDIITRDNSIRNLAIIKIMIGILNLANP